MQTLNQCRGFGALVTVIIGRCANPEAFPSQRIADTILNSIIWFFTLRERAHYEAIWLAQPPATQVFLQDSVSRSSTWSTAGPPDLRRFCSCRVADSGTPRRSGCSLSEPGSAPRSRTSLPFKAVSRQWSTLPSASPRSLGPRRRLTLCCSHSAISSTTSSALSVFGLVVHSRFTMTDIPFTNRFMASRRFRFCSSPPRAASSSLDAKRIASDASTRNLVDCLEASFDIRPLAAIPSLQPLDANLEMVTPSLAHEFDLFVFLFLIHICGTHWNMAACFKTTPRGAGFCAHLPRVRGPLLFPQSSASVAPTKPLDVVPSLNSEVHRRAMCFGRQRAPST